jgi:hypothetical protein
MNGRLNMVQFYVGLGLAILAGIIVLVGESENATSISIVIGILGIGLIATAHRRGR